MTQEILLKKTPLYNRHLSLGAKMAPFGGFEMPIQYKSIIKEHELTRNAATIFDTCHMGEIHISGRKALSDLENILTCSISGMKDGQCRYGFICNENGGVIDDQIIYRYGDDNFLIVVNASTRENDYNWINEHLSEGTCIEDISDETAKIDIQGPKSPSIIKKLVEQPIEEMKYFHFKKNIYNNREILVSRTGYTGEIGFEIYCDTGYAETFFNDCLDLGAVPAGLGARDTLRLEMGMPLYGHELSIDRNAAEAGYSFAIAADKQFIGASAVLNPSLKTSTLAGLELNGRRSARHGDIVFDASGKNIGVITSGSFSPSLQKAIALGYIPVYLSEIGTNLFIDTGRQVLEAQVVKFPFYRKATGRKPISDFV